LVRHALRDNKIVFGAIAIIDVNGAGNPSRRKAKPGALMWSTRDTMAESIDGRTKKFSTTEASAGAAASRQAPKRQAPKREFTFTPKILLD
jgi:hypothetical protein